jgi:hypothetical protein
MRCWFPVYTVPLAIGSSTAIKVYEARYSLPIAFMSVLKRLPQRAAGVCKDTRKQGNQAQL